MANNHGTTGELLESIFQCTQCVNVKVVCWFVQQQHVSAALQHLRKVNTVALTTGKIANKLLLIGTFEVETCNVCTTMNFTTTHLHVLNAFSDFFVHRLCGIERVTVLVDVAELHCVAYRN